MDEYGSLSVKERVRNGAEWLDIVAPGWEERIDIETLDMRSGVDCICGQVFQDECDDYNNGYDYAEKKRFHFLDEAMALLLATIKSKYSVWMDIFNSNLYNPLADSRETTEGIKMISRITIYFLPEFLGFENFRYEGTSGLKNAWIDLIESRL